MNGSTQEAAQNERENIQRSRDKNDNTFTKTLIIIIEGERAENGGESIFKEMITGNFLELTNDVNSLSQKPQVPSTTNENKFAPTHMGVQPMAPQRS